MNKKIWIGFIAVFIVLQIMDYLIHGVLLANLYQWMNTAMPGLMRPEGTKVYIFMITGLIFSFFVSLIFSKGYEGKGLMEGLRYGFYVSMIVSLPTAYGEYAVHPIPYSVALKWFCAGFVEMLVVGAVLALIFGKAPSKAPAT